LLFVKDVLGFKLDAMTTIYELFHDFFSCLCVFMAFCMKNVDLLKINLLNLCGSYMYHLLSIKRLFFSAYYVYVFHMILTINSA
jgi:hypothetical protein